MDSNERCDKAIAILQHTHDGDDLLPKELWIVQEMVNGHLNNKGVRFFMKIYRARVPNAIPSKVVGHVVY
jgi:hypothetical protein